MMMVSLFGQTQQAPPTLSYVDRAVVTAAASSCAEIRAVVPAAPSCREKKGTPQPPFPPPPPPLSSLRQKITWHQWQPRRAGYGGEGDQWKEGVVRLRSLERGGVCCFIHSFDLGTKQQKPFSGLARFFFTTHQSPITTITITTITITTTTNTTTTHQPQTNTYNPSMMNG